MQVSWIDPEEIRRLVAQLSGPEKSPENTVWELHTQPIATPFAVPHGRLLDSSEATAPPSPPSVSSPQRSAQAAPTPEAQNTEIWRIRERLRLLRVKAQQSGIILPSNEVVAAPPTEQPASVEPIAEAAPVAMVAPLASAAHAAEATPIAEATPEPTSFQLPAAETIEWATRQDAPLAEQPEADILPEPQDEPQSLASITQLADSPTLPPVSAQRLESLGPMLAEAAAALAAHARQQTLRLSLAPPVTPNVSAEPPAQEAPTVAFEPGPSMASLSSKLASVEAIEKQISRPEAKPAELASNTAAEPAPEAVAEVHSSTENAEPNLPRLSLRNPRSSVPEALRPGSTSPLSLRVAPHLVAKDRQPPPGEIGQPLSVATSVSADHYRADHHLDVEPLFGPLATPSVRRPEPATEVPAIVNEVTNTVATPSPTEAAKIPAVAGQSELETAAQRAASGTSPMFRVADMMAEASKEERPTSEAELAANPSPPKQAVQSEAKVEPASKPEPEASLLGTREESTSQAPAKTEAESPPPAPSLPPLLPFKVPSLGLSERLAALADWACKGLATQEILLVDDYGDVLWGGQGQTALVLSAMMAWHSSQRSAPASAVAQQRRIDKLLACGRHLTVIPARTRYGVVSLAAIRAQTISDIDANRIHDALIMSVEATGLA